MKKMTTKTSKILPVKSGVKSGGLNMTNHSLKFVQA